MPMINLIGIILGIFSIHYMVSELEINSTIKKKLSRVKSLVEFLLR